MLDVAVQLAVLEHETEKIIAPNKMRRKSLRVLDNINVFQFAITIMLVYNIYIYKIFCNGLRIKISMISKSHCA